VNAESPQRLLVVSATIGEGHNATARAIEERARWLWPGCEIRRVDTLDLMGSWVGPGFRWIYRVNVDTTPWLYDYFYRSLWRHPWFAGASCRFVGAWSGLRLAPVIASYQPDLVVSTYPLGTAGLDWIRRRDGLNVPVAAIISDFAPHPFWVYPEVDLHYVASHASLQAMHRARPEARGAVGAPPVVAAFAPATQVGRIAARRRCGLPEDRLIVLVSCGSLGFGSMERAVEAALAAGPQVCVVVACGRNEALRATLMARSEPLDRLVPLGWTTEMPALTVAADAVVTNAGGASALEALASGRAVLMFEPIAGHGRANAELMAQAGLATLCQGPAELVAAVGALPARQAEAEQRALTHVGALDLDTEIAALPGLPRHHGARPLAASDAFFAHAATATVPQQVGAVLLLDGVFEQPAVQLAQRITDRAPALPMLRRRLDLRRGRRPRWLAADDIDPSAHLRTRTVGSDHGVSFVTAVQEFFATSVPLNRPPWQLELIHDTDTSQTAILAKLHHTLGDGLAVTATLLALLSDQQTSHLQRAQRGSSRLEYPAEYGARRWGARLTRAGRVVRGLASLAAAGPAPAGGPVGVSTPGREYGMVALPAAAVRARAREHGVSTTALLMALVGETLHRINTAGTTKRDRLRTMVPRTTHALRRASADGGLIAGSAGGDLRAGSADGGLSVGSADGDRYQGNHTAAIALDLPVGPMPLSWRMAAVAAALRSQERADQPVAAQAVVRALGRLPAPLHAHVVRAIYGRRFFSLITSVLPGARKPHYVCDMRVMSVFPVLPLADGVGLAVGFLTWADMIGVGVTTDTGLAPGAARFADALREAFNDLGASRGTRRSPGTARG
jgi:diacylglycerol O-acyltransferase